MFISPHTGGTSYGAGTGGGGLEAGLLFRLRRGTSLIIIIQQQKKNPAASMQQKVLLFKSQITFLSYALCGINNGFGFLAILIDENLVDRHYRISKIRYIWSSNLHTRSF